MLLAEFDALRRDVEDELKSVEGVVGVEMEMPDPRTVHVRTKVRDRDLGRRLHLYGLEKAIMSKYRNLRFDFVCVWQTA